ncbi:MAG TPA: TSUP family transporter, partial [Gemmatimonadaceae bacterium]|nr:TSUP family transporter [Gemmatimonadaceae bacterium]
VQPERWLAAPGARRHAPLWIELPVFFAIGIYGGFIQIGVGIFLSAALVLCSGYDLVAANALKNVLVLAFTAAALVVFIVNHQVQWALGLVVAVFQGVGAWLAVHVTLRRGAGFVRVAMIVIVAASAIALFAGLRP